MRIFGSNEHVAKPDLSEAKRKDNAAAGVKQSPAAKPAEDVSKGAAGPDMKGGPEAAEKPSGQAVVLSATASRFSEVSSEQQAARAERLQEVKKLLDEGRYEVDFDRLADGIFSEEVAGARR